MAEWNDCIESFNARLREESKKALEVSLFTSAFD